MKEKENKTLLTKVKDIIKSPRLNKAVKLIFPPVFVICFMLILFKKAQMYPFGTLSLSWCDMSQQVIPLLNDFKDILDENASMFLNFHNSGGMDLYGVFFFFLSSPFTFLVKFVAKEDMMMFANVLVMLKMACCAFTAAVCFTYTRPKLDTPNVLLLSIMYPFCGYTMMYYQNIIWLDMMYLFPLLIMSLIRLSQKHKPIMYIIVLSASVVVNYYISYMVVVFILLWVGLYAVSTQAKDRERVCRDFFIGSFISALITAVVWLPSLVQYIGSGRGQKGLIESIDGAQMFPAYTTMMPILMCTAFAAIVVCADAVSGRPRSARNNRFLIMLGLTLIPFLFEPINKMWHTGNYMSFPGRFGYMTIFLALFCCAYALEYKVERRAGVVGYILWAATCIFAVISCFKFSGDLIEDEQETISQYVKSLWGNDSSFKLLSGLFAVMLAAYGLIYIAYRRGVMIKAVFSGLTALVFIVEASANCAVYITFAAANNEETNQSQAESYSLGGQIDDERFYRVKSYSKVYNNNLIGAMGYNSISHYTSLNNRDYMFTMKRMGYSGVWMETASVGGSRMTDALLSIAYEINGGESHSEEIFKNDAGFIHRLPEYLPMGLFLPKGALSDAEYLPENYEREQIQEFISEHIFGENIIEKYQPAEGVTFRGGKYYIPNGTVLHYTIDTSKERTIYVDCFDELTNNLSEPIFDCMEVTINGNDRGTYPTSTNNGVYRIGDYEGENAEVELRFKEDVECASFGVFGVDVGRLEELCSQAKGAYLNVSGSGLSGVCNVDEACSCFVSVPYSDNFKITVNGKKVPYSRAFSDFVAFDLEPGENTIILSYKPKCFGLGEFLTFFGLALLELYIYHDKKFERELKCDKAARYVMLTVSALTLFAVYVMPIIIRIFIEVPE